MHAAGIVRAHLENFVRAHAEGIPCAHGTRLRSIVVCGDFHHGRRSGSYLQPQRIDTQVRLGLRRFGWRRALGCRLRTRLCRCWRRRFCKSRGRLRRCRRSRRGRRRRRCRLHARRGCGSWWRRLLARCHRRRSLLVFSFHRDAGPGQTQKQHGDQQVNPCFRSGPRLRSRSDPSRNFRGWRPRGCRWRGYSACRDGSASDRACRCDLAYSRIASSSRRRGRLCCSATADCRTPCLCARTKRYGNCRGYRRVPRRRGRDCAHPCSCGHLPAQRGQIRRQFLAGLVA